MKKEMMMIVNRIIVHSIEYYIHYSNHHVASNHLVGAVPGCAGAVLGEAQHVPHGNDIFRPREIRGRITSMLVLVSIK
jgi:hypothetical protein